MPHSLQVCVQAMEGVWGEGEGRGEEVHGGEGREGEEKVREFGLGEGEEKDENGRGGEKNI